MPENLALSSGSTLRTYASWALILGLVLMPVFIVPVAWFPFQLTKFALFAILLAIAAVLFSVVAWRDRSLAMPRSLISAAIVAYLAAVVVSTLLSQNPAASVLAEGVEVDTLFFTCSLVAVFFVSSFLIRGETAIANLWRAVLVAGVVVGLFQVAQLLFGPGLLGSSVFTTVSSNLVGKWNDLAIFMTFVALASMLVIDIRRVRGNGLFLPAGAFVLGAVFMAIINFDGAWWVALVTAVAAGVVSYFTALRSGKSLMQRIPVASVIVAVLAGVFLMWGSVIAPKLATALSIQELDVRPSASATVAVMRATYSQSTLTTLFGSGPNTFGEQWLLNKPSEVNLSAFWNADFPAGFGSIPSMFVNLGVVGGLLLLLIPLLLIVSLVKLVRSTAFNSNTRTGLTVIGLSTLALFGLCFVYAVGQWPFIFSFALLGAYVALHGASHASVSFATPATPHSLSRYATFGAFLLVVVVPVGLAGISLQRFSASMYLGHALVAAGSNNLDGAERYAKRSLAIRNSDDANRLLANIKVARAQAVVSSTTGTEQERGKAFQTAVSDAIAYARAAVAASPREYGNWLSLARIYEALIPAKVQGAYQSAQQTYVEAIRRNPRNPGIYLAAARMEGAAGSEQTLRDAVNQALTLKPNYTDAVLLIVQLEIAKNNLPGALQASMVAVQTAPDNAGLWLQLGLLALNANKPSDAALAFERALKLMPDYANAKYFLSLTYYQLGKAPEAISLMNDLATTNPENTEVALILANMRKGAAPFAGAKPPVKNPAQPATPPIKEK